MYRITKIELYDEDLNLIKEETIDECIGSTFQGALDKASKYCENRALIQYLPLLCESYITDVEDGFVWFKFENYNFAVKIDIAEFRKIETYDFK